ncbi:MAG: hypothetical protein DRI95_08370 [Bacteroidetes bacterium]|nr:MAG: hypothetical protein DRI95_08370 [Bacteroidota bacterium]
MPRLNKEQKEQIRELSTISLQEIVLKMAAKDKSFFDFVNVNYLDKEAGEQELFEKTKCDLDILFSKGYKGFSRELQLANMLIACTKRLNEFTKVSKNKVFEAELLMYILELPFSVKGFGTCFTTYDTKTAIILRRLINLVTKKMHPDYLIEYQDKINKYLKILHSDSNHIDSIYALPESV